MIKIAAALAIFAGAFALPAGAVTYDAFASFNGSQGAGNFIYGTTDLTTGPTLFTSNTGCLASTTCLAAVNGTTPPYVYKSTTTGSFGTVIIPNDRLVVHPGPTATDGAVFVAFVSPLTRTYDVTSSFSVQDVSPGSVRVLFLYEPVFGIPNFTALPSLNSSNLTGSYTTRVALPTGGIVAMIFEKDGVFFNDSTGVNLTLTAVPEPATWGMMIAGFAMVGTVMRRRLDLTSARRALN